MPGSKYRLTYFPIKGRAELIRLIFHAARVPFVDRRVSGNQWKELKSKTPNGMLPVLEFDGQVLDESSAICTWAARKFGLMGKSDAEELKTLAVLNQATEFREKYIGPFFTEQDSEKIENLKKELGTGVDKVFKSWEAIVVQTESNGGKIFSYMITQSMTVADLAVLYVADLTQYYVTVDWDRFPCLAAVISTVSALPPLKAYLCQRDRPAKATPKVTTPVQSSEI